eukprot:TRINITY_DN9370_c0_g1_i2.p1 TRINITY_DN9370_c0_g1~~TRINITY_DN9370_c0_g1_i2.p1  ORF type:complete len:194 (+),score=22.04 TRINITY_DN9370_c0_g1_i2:115-696(+)
MLSRGVLRSKCFVLPDPDTYRSQENEKAYFGELRSSLDQLIAYQDQEDLEIIRCYLRGKLLQDLLLVPSAETRDPHRLPKDVFQEILRLLDPLSFFSCLGVSKGWFQIARECGFPFASFINDKIRWDKALNRAQRSAGWPETEAFRTAGSDYIKMRRRHSSAYQRIGLQCLKHSSFWANRERVRLPICILHQR